MELEPPGLANWRSIVKTVNRECEEIVTSCLSYNEAHLVSFRDSWGSLVGNHK